MSRIRHAYLMASVEQYLGLVINLAMVAILARLLTPGEVGRAVIGMGISATAFSLREFASPEFLIQRTLVAECQTAFKIGSDSYPMQLRSGLAIPEGGRHAHRHSAVVAHSGGAYGRAIRSRRRCLRRDRLGPEQAGRVSLLLIARTLGSQPICSTRSGSSVGGTVSAASADHPPVSL
jgi:hypothetical protein